MTLTVHSKADGRPRRIRDFVSAAIVGLLLAGAAVRVGKADARAAKRWARTVHLRLSRHKLGLPASTSAPRLARAALHRFAPGLRLPRSLAGVRLERDQRAPSGPGGGVELHSLRFQQKSGGRRVLWSQIDVLVGGRVVGSIDATVVAVKPGRPAAQAKVSRRRALTIAHRVLPARKAALAPQLVTYAGNPARGHAPRLAYAIETLGAVPTGDDAPSGICVVIDAGTGRLLSSWRGSAAHSPAPHAPRSAAPHARSARLLIEQTIALNNAGVTPAPPLQLVHDAAGSLLYQLPAELHAAARFVSVTNALVDLATAKYPSPQVAASARQAFLVDGGMTQGAPPCSPTAPPPPADVAVSDVRGDTPRSELAAVGLALGAQRSVVDDTCNDIGAVISQTPSAGTRVGPGSAVNVSIEQQPPHPCP